MQTATDDRSFLIEVFKECNAHMRATERKSLIVTGSYIGLFSILVSTSVGGQQATDPSRNAWVALMVFSFFLIVGSTVYLMQQWYRAWKEHYMEVCLSIRKTVMEEVKNQGALQYWLRQDIPESRISVDEVLKYLTVGVNVVVLLMICYTGLPLFVNANLGVVVAMALVVGYLGFLYVVDRGLRKSNFLFA